MNKINQSRLPRQISKKSAGNRGLIKTILVIVVALIVLGYFGFNLRDTMSSPTVQDNLSYAGQVATNLWNNYLKSIAEYIWNNVIVKALPYVIPKEAKL